VLICSLLENVLVYFHKILFSLCQMHLQCLNSAVLGWIFSSELNQSYHNLLWKILKKNMYFK
jgi:hypothetical protein